jgi:N-(2-amino-2-carboxyethyl)-L-glutamate synthase
MTLITSVEPLQGFQPFCNGKKIFVKMEGEHETRSMKQRSAELILEDMHSKGWKPTVLESTSGNMGVALAYECRKYGQKCVLVVDPKLSPWHRSKMNFYGAEIIDVTERDNTGGWLKTRLRAIKCLLQDHKDDWFWVNQYENPLNPAAFENMSHEIAIQLKDDLSRASNVYLVMPVSTGGSISGLARGMKKRLDKTQKLHVIAVDAKGSAIFGQKPENRFLNGIGSSLSEPPNLDRSLLEDHIIVSDVEAFLSCYKLRKAGLFVGGSSGAVAVALNNVQFLLRGNDVAIGVFPDHGEIYNDTIYSDKWMMKHLPEFTRDV